MLTSCYIFGIFKYNEGKASQCTVAENGWFIKNQAEVSLISKVRCLDLTCDSITYFLIAVKLFCFQFSIHRREDA